MWHCTDAALESTAGVGVQSERQTARLFEAMRCSGRYPYVSCRTFQEQRACEHVRNACQDACARCRRHAATRVCARSTTRLCSMCINLLLVGSALETTHATLDACCVET